MSDMHKCGCHIYEAVWDNPYIVYCPMHAAAPDLLRALLAVMREYEPPDDCDLDCLVLARTAIAKATGEAEPDDGHPPDCDCPACED